MNTADFEEKIKFFALEAGKGIMPFFRKSLHVENKTADQSFDPVTEADKTGEAILRRLITDHYPDHGILGEEYGLSPADSDYMWVLDPIDGTRAFIAGLPTWGILVALLNKGRPVCGVMYQPFTGELFYGNGSRAYLELKGERTILTGRQNVSLSQAHLSTTSPFLFAEEKIEQFRQVEKKTRLSRYGFDCYAYCMLAAGHIDIIMESGLNLYDIAALIPIIEGAGGVITNWQGSFPDQGGDILACGSSKLHEEALSILAK